MKTNKMINSFIINGVLAIICLCWTVPTIGLLISSFRDRIDINRTTGQYSVSASELLEIKTRAAALFAGKPT